MITIGSLFSGIGGLDLGVEIATGGRVIWLAESDPFCREVLARHWPGVPCYTDVREIDQHAQRPDLVCGGFPCQDVSTAGTQAGLDGSRSGLWSEFARIVRVLRPPLVYVENVPGLFIRGFDEVLGDLAACGYDAEWSVFSAAGAGAPHLRKRVFLLAASMPAPDTVSEIVRLLGQRRGEQHDQPGTPLAGDHGGDGSVADPDGRGCEMQWLAQPGGFQGQGGDQPDRRCHHGGEYLAAFWRYWQIEPPMGRVVDRATGRMVRATKRLEALGNSVVPQCAAWAFEVLIQRLAE